LVDFAITPKKIVLAYFQAIDISTINKQGYGLDRKVHGNAVIDSVLYTCDKK